MVFAHENISQDPVSKKIHIISCTLNLFTYEEYVLSLTGQMSIKKYTWRKYVKQFNGFPKYIIPKSFNWKILIIISLL